MVSHSIEAQLLNEPAGQLELQAFCIVTADTTVREAVERMTITRQNCALVVGKGTRLVGILTDRDVLRKVVTHPETWDEPVENVMTHAPDTLSPHTTTREALRRMAEKGYRNLPVIDAHNTIRGNVTYYSILKFLTDHFPEAVYNLPPDPSNFAQERDGG